MATPASQDLFAKFRATIFWSGTPQNLYSKTFIRNAGSGNLKGQFYVGQGAGNLKGVFQVGQNSADLFAKFGIQANQVLFAKFISRHAGAPLTIYVEFIIRHPGSQDLFAEFGIAHWLDLFAKAEIRHSASANLFAEFVVRHPSSEDLKAGFRITTEAYVNQGISVEAYIALSVVV
jgi:hypothetical protein